MTLRDLEKVIYYSNYVVIDPGQQDVRPNQLLDEEEYLNLRTKAREENEVHSSPTSVRRRCASFCAVSTWTASRRRCVTTSSREFAAS